MKLPKINPVLGLAGILATGVIITSVNTFAYEEGQQENAPRFSTEKHEQMKEKHEEMKTLFENKDYNGWVALITKDGRTPKILETINEENFDKLIEAHQLKSEGKYEEAKAILEELGVKREKGKRSHNKKGHFQSGEFKEKREEVKKAFEAKDYEAWKTIITQDGRTPKILETITEENFDRLVEMHELKKEGKYEEAKEIRDELGLKDKKGCRGNKDRGNREGGNGENKGKGRNFKQNRGQRQR